MASNVFVDHDIGMDDLHLEPSLAGDDNMNESFGDDYSAAVPDILLLNHHCANAIRPRDASDEARQEAEESWEPVREWLRTHDADEVRNAAEQRGESSMTALHFACRNVPPLDVIDVFLSIAQDVVQWPDSFGWLPIHYACACGAEAEVIRSLADAFPDSKTTYDRRGRTPLHFALGNSNKPVSPDVVFLLSSTGAAGFSDDNGMLPIHYACAYGASEDALYALTDAFPEGITTVDKRGRTPLHFALSNAARSAAPAAVRLLISINRDTVNSLNGGPLPLRVLAEFAKSLRNAGPEELESVERCLEHLLNARPDPTADFFTALQSLPDWLSSQAVILPVVQVLLNEKISQRFPTAVLMLDVYVLVMVIFFYSFRVVDSIDKRFPLDLHHPSEKEIAISGNKLVPLYLGVAYFFIRECIQIVSLISLKSIDLWLFSLGSWLNVAFIFLVLYWTILMHFGTGDPHRFQTGVALSVTILWLKFLAFLRNMLIEFAVFVGGLFYVLRRLVAFIMASTISLVAFSLIFYTVFQQTDYCLHPATDNMTSDQILASFQCDNGNLREVCHSFYSFLNLYTMYLGNVNDNKFNAFFEDGHDSNGYFFPGHIFNAATFLYIIFMFLVCILMSNVLIAIVIDRYKVIQDRRATIVFWTNRLDFIAEMDAIANGPWKSRIKRAIGFSKPSGDPNERDDRPISLSHSWGKEFWKRLMDLFDDEIDVAVMSFEFICYTLLRAAVAVIIVPLWLALGILTVGWLWPPQVREFVFTSTVTKFSSVSEKENELRKTQVKLLEHEVNVLRDDLLQELAIGRTLVIQMKSVISERKQEIMNEMKQIKRIMTMLFEQFSNADGQIEVSHDNNHWGA